MAVAIENETGAAAAGVAGVAGVADAVGPMRSRPGDIGADAKRRAELDSAAWRETGIKGFTLGNFPKSESSWNRASSRTWI